jgi:hypothetical protein
MQHAAGERGSDIPMERADWLANAAFSRQRVNTIAQSRPRQRGPAADEVAKGQHE